MKDSIIAVVLLVLLLLGAAAGGYLMLTRMNKPLQQTAATGVQAAESGGKTGAEGAELGFESSEPEEREVADIKNLTIRATRENGRIRIFLRNPTESPGTLSLDAATDVVEVVIGGRPQPIPIEQFFELDELALNVGELSMPVEQSLDAKEGVMVEVVFRRTFKPGDDGVAATPVEVRVVVP